MNRCFAFLGLMFMFSSASGETERVEVGRFSSGDIRGWQQEEFVGQTRYRLEEVDGRQVLAAHSAASASAYYREIDVDLGETPILNWSWRLRQRVQPENENEKPGDDFAARVYVVRKGGLAFWNTRAINYVWSWQHKTGEAWDNPFAGSNARMLALRDRQDPAGVWMHEKRNVVDDFRQLFGKDIDSIDGIAIMSDSDNTGQSAAADYGDIYFSGQ